MQSFKQYLLTEKVGPGTFAPWHISDPEKVQHFMSNYAKWSGWKVNKDGTVSVTKVDYTPLGVFGDIGGEGHGETALMVKYRNAKKFEIIMGDDANFKSLWGVPDVCNYLGVSSHTLETLEHCTPTIKGSLYLYTPNLKRFDCGNVTIADELKIGSIGQAPLSDLHKYFQVPTIRFFTMSLDAMFRKPVLSLLKCNAKITWGTFMNPEVKTQEVMKVIQILNKHNRQSILDCQEELIDAGYKDYAEL